MHESKQTFLAFAALLASLPFALLGGLACTYSPVPLSGVEETSDAGPTGGATDPGDPPPPSPIDRPSDGGLAAGADAAGARRDATTADRSGNRPPDGGPPPVTCGPTLPCPGQENCLQGVCVPAPASCAGIKSRQPTAPDGLYWVVEGGMPRRSYCDMATGQILCGPTAQQRNGRTREGSNQPFTFMSQLMPGDSACKIWAVRHATDGYPFNRLARTAGLTLDTCQAFGFRGNGALDQQCAYGRERTDCGFGIQVPFFLWGNDCDCVRRPDGSPQPRFVRQGEGIRAGSLEIGVSVGTIPWNVSGTVFGTCAVK